MSPTATPSPSQLLEAPELAPLAMLDATLGITRIALLAHSVALSDPEGALHNGKPALSSVLATLLVDRLEELHTMIDWYRVAIDPAIRPADFAPADIF